MEYDDIINLPHHVSTTRPHMSMHDRAAQFSPFAALSGYGEAVEEVARVTEEEIELDEQTKAEINRQLNYLKSNLPVTVTITYFHPDERKSGGTYLALTGTIKEISLADRLIVMENGQIIPIDSLVDLELAEE